MTVTLTQEEKLIPIGSIPSGTHYKLIANIWGTGDGTGGQASCSYVSPSIQSLDKVTLSRVHVAQDNATTDSFSIRINSAQWNYFKSSSTSLVIPVRAVDSGDWNTPPGSTTLYTPKHTVLDPNKPLFLGEPAVTSPNIYIYFSPNTNGKSYICHLLLDIIRPII